MIIPASRRGLLSGSDVLKGRAAISFIICCLGASGCSSSDSETATLYRNSSIGATLGNDMRIHVATFDADDVNSRYNRENCEMSARLYNANVRALNPESDQKVGFWCESGLFSDNGSIPFSFDAEFPTETP